MIKEEKDKEQRYVNFSEIDEKSKLSHSKGHPVIPSREEISKFALSASRGD